MTNMQHADLVFEYAIENFVRIANERDGIYPRPLHNAGGCLGMFDDVNNGFADAYFDRRGHRLAERSAFPGYFSKIARCALTVFNPHAGRNVLNAASTSASLATPLRSASSSASSSSGVA